MIKECLNCNNEYKTKASYNSKYCSIKCQKDFEYKEYIKSWKDGEIIGFVGDPKYGQVSKHIRRYLSEIIKSCSNCGLSEWMGKPITLEIEHIDGNFYNNFEPNLTLLCPNCHSQTDTYKAKNKGNGRDRH